ncbi:hypothetical protein J6A64_03875 [bacterium]|nr:hypothetical protein [bacterium]MBO5446952.1 hypothetical protein [bacterium]
MKKLLTTLGLFAFLSIPTQAFAWTYNGLGSLNPFTNFGRNDNVACGCQKVEKCKKPRLTKCEKLHGVKIKRGCVTGCAAPIQTYYYKVYPNRHNCNNCQRAFD